MSYLTDFSAKALAAGATAAKKQQALATKKGSFLEGLGGFLGDTLDAYVTSRAQPATVAPAPPPPAPSMTPTLLIVGAAALGLVLVLRRR
jgi:MYXO-CTERM domain-containing protein